MTRLQPSGLVLGGVDAAVVTAGEHTEVYVHVQSATLAGLDGDAKLVMASADPVAVEQNLYSSDNTGLRTATLIGAA